MKLVLASDLHGSALYTGQLMKRIEAEAPDRVLLLGRSALPRPRNDLPEGYAPKQVIPHAERHQGEDRCGAGQLRGGGGPDGAGVPGDGGVHHPLRWKTASCCLPPTATTLTRASAADSGGQRLAFGHVHVKHLEWKDGILILNPGSVSIPKDGTHSYMTYRAAALSRSFWTARRWHPWSLWEKRNLEYLAFAGPVGPVCPEPGGVVPVGGPALCAACGADAAGDHFGHRLRHVRGPGC